VIVQRWLRAIGAFWVDFVVGDDWTVAAAVAGGLVATAVLVAFEVPAWWLLPLVVVIATTVSVRRASRPSA
jgi:hypothetical protein